MTVFHVNLIMYLSTRCSSSSAFLRASRLPFASTLSTVPTFTSISPVSRIFSFPSFSRHIQSAAPFSVNYRSFFSSALPSLSYSTPRWSHGVDWRSPISLRAQIRTASPDIERLDRNIATMGISPQL